MIKGFMLAAVMTLGTATSALAACPSQVPGSTIEAIKANEQRVLCLLREVEAVAQQRQYESQLKALENSVRDLQLQQRFNAMPSFTAPAPFVPPML